MSEFSKQLLGGSYPENKRTGNLMRRARHTVAAALAASGLGIGIANAALAQPRRAANPTPSAANTAKNAHNTQKISARAHALTATMARQIIGLAKAGHGKVSRPDNVYVDEVAVTIKAPIAPGYARVKGATMDDYTLYANISAPADARHSNRHQMNSHELSELDPNGVKGIKLNVGYSTQLAYQDVGMEGLVFRGDYLRSSSSSALVIRAAINPVLPHDRRLTNPMLTSAIAQGEALIQNSSARTPIDFLAVTAFQPRHGENDSQLPAF